MEYKEKVYQAAAARIIAHLNEKTGAHFRATAYETRTHVTARLRDGFTEQDLTDVIDAMCREWLGNETMERYLRPVTLFRSNDRTESYLRIARKARKKGAQAKSGQFRSADDLLED